MQSRFNHLCIMVLGVLLLAGCSTTSEGRKQLSLVTDERAVRDGTRAFQRIKNRNVLSNDPSESKFVACVAEALAPGPWDIAVLRDDHANAFALPGNKIAVNSGLLRVAVNQDQLATVIAHEIAHIHAKHGNERTSQQVALELISQYSNIRSRGSSSNGKAAGLVLGIGGVAVQLGLLYPFGVVQEEEADLIGLELMANAGFDPNEALSFWTNMEVYGAGLADGPLSTHPTHQTRIATLKKRIADRGWNDSSKFLPKTSRPTCDEAL